MDGHTSDCPVAPARGEQSSSEESSSRGLDEALKKTQGVCSEAATLSTNLAFTVDLKPENTVYLADMITEKSSKDFDIPKACQETSLENVEDVIDVSPTGFTLSSLASVKQELAGRVKHMFVFDNTFNVLPSSIRNFKNLRKLKFFSNEVRTVPQELGDLSHLEQLYLKICPTGLGSLPPLGKLRSLRALELHQEPARPSSSSLSREIAQLHSLTRLSICHFSISWIPPEIGSLTNLEDLDLSFNKIKVLPNEVSGLVALKSLRVASNKLVELPSQLTDLPNLSIIDVSHNRLTSLTSLGLMSMTTLKTLNAQFNKLEDTGAIPTWVKCKLEGNETLQRKDIGCMVEKDSSCNEDCLLDWESLPSTSCSDAIEEGNANPQTVQSPSKTSALKGHMVLKGRRGWKKQDNQQNKARQDRLNSSRKHRTDELEKICEAAPESIQSADEMNRKDETSEEMFQGQERSEVIGLISVGKKMGGHEPYDTMLPKLEHSVEQGMQCRCKIDIESNNELRLDDESQQDGENSVPALIGFQESEPDEFVCCEAKKQALDEKNNCRKTISGDRSTVVKGVATADCDNGAETNYVSPVVLKIRRRPDGTMEETEKPKKRRRAVPEFSKAAFKYSSESFCGFFDCLHDGFYDAGRDRPFIPLEVLEKEQPCFDSREVILVDRNKDEELDVIALSAQRLLADFASSKNRKREFQRIEILALFVSDCFGGSDKTSSISNMRRAALGNTSGMPFVCSCSCNGVTTTGDKGSQKHSLESFLPTVHMLCEGAVRFLKAQRRSNVLPIGSIAYGICRHRAILFKYLCDRADPIIPCELVRGYLDYMPHAWNVVLVENSSGNVRMLVDACRPLDIRIERDPEYFCRYIPLRRIHLPLGATGELKVTAMDVFTPILHEDIGHGASGAVVRRCTLGSFTAAAKVMCLEDVAEGQGMCDKGLESSSLSELRLLCSLPQHPCIVAFYGHQISTGFCSSSSNSANLSLQSPQLMIFMEYIPGGCLEVLLQDFAEKGNLYLPPKLALRVARNVACAMSLLHSMGIIHRDIKSSNVLIDFRANQEPDLMVVKLCDFDSAVPLQSSAAHTCYLAHRGVPPADVCVGTPRWIAPEVLRAMYGRHSYGLEADVWSFGCLLAELLTLNVPHAGLTEIQVHSCIQMGQRPQLSPLVDKLRLPPADEHASSISDETKILRVLVALFYSCTDPNPSRRPTAGEVFSILSATLSGDTQTESSLEVQFEKIPEGPDISKQLITPEADQDPTSLSGSCNFCSASSQNCSCTLGKQGSDNDSINLNIQET